jgi:hypothetical protein
MTGMDDGFEDPVSARDLEVGQLLVPYVGVGRVQPDVRALLLLTHESRG